MAVTNYTTLLGLALPTTGDLSGTWGDTVNTSITSLLDSAIAGTTTLSTDVDTTLSTTNGASNQARQQIIVCSGARTALRTITAPAASKSYIIINSTTGGFGVKIVGAGPTTGVTIANGDKALVAWNGSDFVVVSHAALTTSDISNLGTGVASALTTNVGTAGSFVVNGGVLGTPSSGTVTNLTGTASININGTVGATTPAAGTFTSLSDSGNLTFTGTGNRITGDFSNATIASRVMFQTSTTNGVTAIGVLPNGTATATLLDVYNNSDPTNASRLRITADNSTAYIESGRFGTGTYLPMVFNTGGNERMRITSTGNVQIGDAAATAAAGGRFLDLYNLENTSAASYVVSRYITYNTAGSATTSFDIGKNKGGAAFLTNNEPSSSSIITFGTQGTERIRITANGGVSFGASGTAYGTAGQVLTSNGDAAPTWSSAASGFDAGTRLIFAQTSAPTGWTKDTTNYNNHALRVVTGAASTGGTVDFTTAFTSQGVGGSLSSTTATNQSYTPTGTVSVTGVTGSAGATTLTTPQIPSHNHPAVSRSASPYGSPSGVGYPELGGGSFYWGYATQPGLANNAGPRVVATQGGDGSHTHPFSFTSGTGSFTGDAASILQNSHTHTFTGTAINLAVKYLDVITATKN